MLVVLCFGADAGNRDACLRAMTTGADNLPIVVCDPGDPLKLSRSEQVRQVMDYLSIEPSAVRFNGCKGALYAADIDPASGSRPGYLITYPAEIDDRYLAPITHELAHVMQMQIAGGKDALRQARSPLKIELGADFVTGIVFREKLSQRPWGEFQNNIKLTGLYRERAYDAHGTPAQRSAAFRFGLHFPFSEDVPDVRIASSYFMDVMYDDIDGM
ncbi:hypothetical protein GCM10027430_30780 [Lysobacter tyrosinilyticus]